MVHLSLALLLLVPAALSGDVPEGGGCEMSRLRLSEGTYALFTDCNSITYCSGGTCRPKGCRRVDFPFEYTNPDDFPRKCPRGEFCPDEEDRCQPLLPVGSDCQLNRDGEHFFCTRLLASKYPPQMSAKRLPTSRN